MIDVYQNENMKRLFLILLLPFLSFAQEPTFTNAIGMEFVLIKPGTMQVGVFRPQAPEPPKASQKNNLGWTPTDYRLAASMAKQATQEGFPIMIRQPYYIGKFEVTQAQWQKVMGSNPSIFQGNKVADDASQHPVDNVTWNDVQQFVKRLNQLDKARHYRLPTEFEWEYAARAGATDDIAWSEIREVAQLGTRTTNRVGQKKPNPWGLYDTLGNVWEWVQDVYNEKQFADPIPPRTGNQHVLKGASFVGDVKNATYLTHAAGPGNGWDVGFRVVVEVK